MPRDIPKRITRKRKPAAALDASEPSSKLSGATDSQNDMLSHHGHGIGELAKSLANLQALSIALGNAEGPAERARKEMAAAGDIRAEEHSKACKAIQHLEDVGRRSHGMLDALEKLILQMEPRTLGETLSLALVLADEMEVFLSNHVGRENLHVDQERLRLGDALRAIIRGLASAGAASPLLEHYSGRHDLMPWSEARSTATRAAAPYLVTYDPAQGCLKQVGADQ